MPENEAFELWDDAVRAVVAAVQSPLKWFGRPAGEQVVFADGFFTVSSNGDGEDYEDPARAVDALAYQWLQQDGAGTQGGQS